MVNLETPPSPMKRRKRTSSSSKRKEPTKFYCKTCDVHCPNEKTLEQHNTGKKHLGNTNNVQRRDKHTVSSIFVGNLPKLAQIRAKLEETENDNQGKENEKLKLDLNTLFGQFGDINKIIIDKNHGSYCIIEYRSPSMAQVVLAEFQAEKLPLFYGKKLQVKSRKMTEIRPLTNIASHNEIKMDNIIALLEEAEGEPDFGLGMVDNAISVPDQAKKLRSEAVSRLQDQLNKHFPFHGVHLTLYGSSETSLALLDSDLDLSLSVAPGKRLERDDLISVLKQKCTGVSHVHVIPAPGGKITRFLDGISSSMCDILFTNRLGIANTTLLSTIHSYDKRIPRLTRLLIYWNKVMLGAKFTKQCIPSSYSITIMVLHYLLQIDIIPDFFDKKISSPQTIYDLDCSHVVDITKFPPSTSTSEPATVSQLMKGFFKYYGSTFKREEHVVNIRSREPLMKQSLVADEMDTETPQHNYVTVFKQAPLCVQDPLIRTHNISHSVTLECAVMFGDYCRAAVDNFESPLHSWLFVGKKMVSGGEGSVEDVGGSADEEEEGNKTPVWEGGEGASVGSKRSADDMEH